MKKLIVILTLALMPFVANATYGSYNGGKNYSSHGHKSKYHNGGYGNPLVGAKMPSGCKWVWVNGKKQTQCGSLSSKLAKFCEKYPNSYKCKKKNNKSFCEKYPHKKKCKKGNPTSVSEPAPLALLSLGLIAAFFARRK